MPELPEVEVVRRGLERWVTGRYVNAVDVFHPRAVRRHPGGSGDFVARLTGRTFLAPRRRGKYFWLPLDSGDSLLAHLGMSGQMLLTKPGALDETHLRVRLALGTMELRFVDQRTFGHLMVADGNPPEPIAHIAADPFSDEFDPEEFHRRLRVRRTEIKRALLDQSLISGVGNIYADEALWRARLHWRRRTATLTRPKTLELVRAVRDVMSEALGQGGTSFDRLYVDVNGENGYFDRSLNVYGRQDEPCARCGTPIRRAPFMNRSSYWCPTCQRRPRAR